MANEKKLRINAIARQLNVGHNTIIEFLESKGITLEHGFNSIIDDKTYNLIVDKFGGDKAVEKINIKEKIKTKNETISLNDIKSDAKEDEAEDEVVVKTSLVDKEPLVKGPKIIGKIDLDGANKKPKQPEPEAVKDVKEPEQPKVETVKEVVKETPVKETKTPEPIKKEEPVVAEQKKEEPVKEETPAHSALSEKTFDERMAEKKDDIFRNDESKLSGPKIIGKIDLSTLDKRSDSSSASRKNKRKRIKKDSKIDINDPKNAQPQGNAQRGGSNQNGNAQRNAQNNAPSNKKKNKKQPIVHNEISDEDVQKQIKDTLARLTSKGNKSKSAKYRKDKREAINARMNEEQERLEQERNILKLTEFVTVSDLAGMMDVPVTDVITACMNLGLMVSINQRLDAEAIVIVAEEFGFKVEFVSVEIQEQIAESEDDPADLVPRPPIVTVMGHVDHGKTSLLDFIRKSNVIEGEAGGITQHIGAYSVKMDDGRRITFLDTPGHEAFTAMRARGASVTDVAIIIIAADDSVMPQTVEAINHASAAGVPIVFAINKIDKPGANPDHIREQLANMNYLVEEWGGKYQCQEISAKKGINVDALLEKVLLEAEMLDLKANPNKRASGVIIESSLDKGRGYVSTVLVQSGTLHIGDVMLSGNNTGRVKAMFNERGQKKSEATPSTPVLVLGLNGAPQAGDTFNIMEDDRSAREIANKREQLQRMQGLKTQKHITLDEIGRRIAIGSFKELNVIIKGDVDGSVEALTDSIMKLSTEEVQVNVIHKAVGQISESDVLLAAASNAVIIGFQVRPSSSARKLAEKEEIEIRTYSIIYDAINEIKDAIVGMLAPEIKEEVVCSVEVMETFKITKVGTVAGCIVREGKITRNTKVRIIRDGIVIYTGKLGSLKRFKDDAKEVVSGLECGLNVENYNDIKIGDIIEGYEEVEVARKL